jgi:TATA-box binding protein (TBP) (component of TFIID and TFIIIB)
MYNLKIRNISATVEMDFSIDVEKFYTEIQNSKGFISYEPEQFPGVIYKMQMNGDNVAFLIFKAKDHKMKVVISGSRSENSLKENAKYIHEKLQMFAIRGENNGKQIDGTSVGN